MSTMRTTPSRWVGERAPVRVRRSGYVLGIAFNMVLLWLINIAPRWEAVPFLTAEAGQAVVLVNAAIVAGVVIYLVELRADPPRLKAAGDLVNAAFALAISLRLWGLFPFDFGETSLPWAELFRVGLGIAIATTTVAILAGIFGLWHADADR